MADSAPIFRSGQPQTYQQGVPYEPPLLTADILAGSQIPQGPEIGGGQGQVAAVVRVRGLGPIVIRAPSSQQLNALREDPQQLNRYLDDRFSEFRGFVDTLYQGMSPADKAAMWTSPIPVVGDAAGLFADALNYIKDPESRTLANGLLTLMSAAPLVPNKRLVDQAEQVKRNIQAWHGSPHRFDKFSMSKIGTGEGAQAYGHGLYFAENRRVAEQYADMAKTLPAKPDKAHVYAAKDFIENNLDPHQGLKQAYPDASLNEIEAAIIEAKGGYRPNLYNTTLNVDPDDLLDWDAPLSEQKGVVAKINAEFPRLADKYITNDDRLGQLMASGGLDSPEWARLVSENDEIRKSLGFAPTDTGEDLYMRLSRNKAKEMGRANDAAGVVPFNDPEASNYLRGLGIPGVRYLDGMSRNAGAGSRNFVIFDDSLININSVE